MRISIRVQPKSNLGALFHIYLAKLSKKRHLLRHGLSSEVFLLAYYLPDSGFGIAKRYERIRKMPSTTPNIDAYPNFPTKSKRPATAKISQELKKLVSDDYLVLKDRKYRANFERLTVDIESRLNLLDIILDSAEKIFLYRLLQQNYFFTFSSFDTLYEIKTQPKRIHHIDAIEEFCNKIGMFCTVALHSKENESDKLQPNSGKTIEQINEELEEITKSINTEFLRKYKKSMRKNKQLAINLTSYTMKSLIVSVIILNRLPLSTAKKLAPLWDQSYGFKIGVMMSEFANLDTNSIISRLETMIRSPDNYW